MDLRSKGWSVGAPATAHSLADLESSIGHELPMSYRRFLSASDGAQGALGYLNSVGEVGEATVALRATLGAVDVVVIGGNGGGEAWIIDFTGADPEFCSVAYIGDGLADALYRCHDLEQFLSLWDRHVTRPPNP